MSFQAAQDVARRWYGELARIDAGDIIAGPYSVAQAMTDYLAHSEREKRRKLPDTRRAINAHILPTLGKIELAKLTQAKVKTWRDGLASAAPRVRTRTGEEQRFRDVDTSDPDYQRKRQATVNRVLTILKAGLNHAFAEGQRVTSAVAWQTVKPFRKVDLAKIRFMTSDEVTRLIACCTDDLGALVRGALLTGARYGELTALTIDAFDPNNETIFIAKSKNGEPRHVELNAEGIAFFGELTKGREASEKMFLRLNGKRWKKSEQQRPMNEACQNAKIEQVTFHILRHTYASHLAMNQTPMRVIADQLGHKDTRITERHYAHLGRSYVRETIRTRLPSFGLIDAPPMAT